MSTYRASAYDPVRRVVRGAWWLDDHFGRHRYGVQFDDDGPIYRPAEVEIPTEVVFVEEASARKDVE